VTGIRESLRRSYRALRGQIWQRRNRARLAVPRPRAAVVHFAIPLISRRRANDWAQVGANLAVTLASLARQTDPRWRAVICGQDRPDTLPDDPRVTFLPCDISDRFNDQLEKGEALTRDLARRETGAGYYFKLDADDILHPGLVAHILADDNGQGYLIDKGYILDRQHLAATGELRMAELVPPRRSHAFFEQCGSCAAFWYDFSRGADFVSLLDKRGSHVELERNLRDFGFRIERVPFPAGIYVMNHGENMRARRGKLSKKMHFFDLAPVADPQRVATEFGIAAPAALSTEAARPA
jgi:hypothetical protein